MQKLLLCRGSTPLDLPLKNKLRQGWMLVAAYTKRKLHFLRPIGKVLDAAKLLFKVSQGFNDFCGGSKLRS